jgi:hypothetical protein
VVFLVELRKLPTFVVLGVESVVCLVPRVILHLLLHLFLLRLDREPVFVSLLMDLYQLRETLVSLDFATVIGEPITRCLSRREELPQVATGSLAEPIGVVGWTGITDSHCGADVGVAEVVYLLLACQRC